MLVSSAVRRSRIPAWPSSRRTTWLFLRRILSASESMISWCTSGTPSSTARPAATSLPSEPISLVIATIAIALSSCFVLLVVEFQVVPEHRQLDERAAVVVGGREAHDVAAGVEALHAVERLHEALARQLRAGAAQRLDRRLGGDVGLERGEGQVLLAEVLLDRDLVFLHDRQRALG